VQDVTEQRAIEARLRRAEEALAAQRRQGGAQQAGEDRAAEAIQEALLPAEPELGNLGGVTVHGRCRSPDRVGGIDGDWYDAMPLSGTRSLVVLGDVDDSGLSSMVTAALLRHAIRAYAAMDMAPGEILTAVNALLIAGTTGHTACVVLARYEPADQTLCWAAAGQLPPVRYTGMGRGTVLSGPLGLPLGEVPDVQYLDMTVKLNTDDRVLLYAGGHARLDRKRGGGLDLVRRAAEHVDLGDFTALIDHVVKAVAGDDEDICALLLHIG
jgi:serine phosphatase RsbU (regulator of sigma subunit)